MTDPINQQPNYSGVTIQILNPAVYAGAGNNGNPCTPNHITNPMGYQNNGYTQNIQNPAVTAGQINNPQQGYETYVTNPQQNPQGQMQAYPAQYYLNNYNYQGSGNIGENNQGGNTNESKDTVTKTNQGTTDSENNVNDTNIDKNVTNTENKEEVGQNNNPPAEIVTKTYEPKFEEPQDFTKSQSVIADLDARAAAAEEEKKNSQQKRVVALTDEYIKSLENYLNNPNDEIRLMASKEILTRLDEDKDRYDDAALNALLNKMMQDPSKLVRIASLSAFSSQLASGNSYTVQLLQNIQQNPNADKEDVLQAADILLKMSSSTEIKNIPNPQVKELPENKG